MTRASTTVRLAVLVFTGQLLAAALLLAGLGAYARWQVNADSDAAVELLRGDLLSVYARDGVSGLAETIDARSRQRSTPHAIMLLTDARFHPLAGRFALDQATVTTTAHIVATTMLDPRTGRSEAVRLRATRLPEGAYLLTGMVVESENQVLETVAEASVAALLVATLLAVLVAWISARMFVAQLAPPIEALAAARHGDFTRRIPTVDDGDAFAMLGREVNATLDDLGAVMTELKLATDALAHDLKSPITRLRAALDRVQGAAAAEPFDAPAARTAVARAQNEGASLLAMVETALSISRAEAGIGRGEFATVDMAAILLDLTEIYGPLAEDGGRTIVTWISGTCQMVGQRELLARAIGNLIDNSLKYGAGTITISQVVAKNRLKIIVADEGQGIAPRDRSVALSKFARLDSARTSSGAGLGLSLASAVAHLHGGDIILSDAAPGLRACLTLPYSDCTRSSQISDPRC